MSRTSRLSRLLELLLMGALGCVATVAPSTLAPVISVSVSPNPAATETGGTVPFQATVTGTGAGQSTAVTWSVPTGSGTVGSSTGLYVAPSTPGTYVVTATSVADPARFGTATVVVSAAPATDLDRLRALASKRIYFQHASMGGEACGVYSPASFTGTWGLKKIIGDNPGSGTSLAENASTAAAIPVGSVGESTHGDLNGQPLAKLQRFDAVVRGGLGGVLDVVMFKIGNADFDQGTNLLGIGGGNTTTWFNNTYRPIMDALQAAYPTTKVIHVTAPVQKASAYWGNANIETWNHLIRTTYPGKYFDFGYWASVTAAGQSPQVSADGAPCMNDAWNLPNDGHLNQAGADWLGEQLLAFLANLR